MNNIDWCSKSVFCEDVKIQTFFRTASQFYIGDPNSDNIEDFMDPKLHIDLPALSFRDGTNDFTHASAIIGHEAQFGQYYRYLIESAYRYRRSYNDIRHHFWQRGAIISKSQNITVSFPWYDSASEFSTIYNWIMSGNEGDEFFDGDQGWVLRGLILNGRAHFLETDHLNWNAPIEEEVFSNACFDLESLRHQVTTNQNTVELLIANLTKEIGIDVWSKYQNEENLKFGTASWKPKKPSRLKRYFQKLQFNR